MRRLSLLQDSVNRRVTMKLLGYATKKRDRQYIFLTPLDNRCDLHLGAAVASLMPTTTQCFLPPHV